MVFRNFFIRRGALPGSCATVCDDICKHKPCMDDFEVSTDQQECVCFPNAKSRCGENTACVSDQCRCLNGYQGNPSVSFGPGCTDTNECIAPSPNVTLNNCGANSFCTNLPGSFNCTCTRGYEGDPIAGCTDLNECTGNPNICGEFGTCSNTNGSYGCQCAPGYRWDAPFGICIDINECAVNATICGPLANCTNTPGNYTCACVSGYSSAGQPPQQPCNDIDECRITPSVCGDNATCSNVAGSFRCRCNNGFIGSPPSCTPDACTVARNGTTCGTNTRCTNSTPPQCECISGYAGNPNVTCTDIDECQIPNICPNTEQCFNLPGSSECLIKAPNQCPTRKDSTCVTGLKCAQESRSDSTYRCCSSFGACTGGFCCNGLYIRGENCPSRNSLDCASGLTCAPTVLLGSTYKCCSDKTLLGVCIT